MEECSLSTGLKARNVKAWVEASLASAGPGQRAICLPPLLPRRVALRPHAFALNPVSPPFGPICVNLRQSAVKLSDFLARYATAIGQPLRFVGNSPRNGRTSGVPERRKMKTAPQAARLTVRCPGFSRFGRDM